jgi:hypothetical protein
MTRHTDEPGYDAVTRFCTHCGFELTRDNEGGTSDLCPACAKEACEPLVCDICGKGFAEDEGIGLYYHRADCKAREILDQINNTQDPAELKRLKRELEQARYVGD